MSVSASDSHVRRATPPREPPASLAEVSETAHPAEPEAPPSPIGPPAVTSVENLWNIARDALKIDPPLWVSSIFGLPWTWLPPFQRYSEFRIIDLWQPLRSHEVSARRERARQFHATRPRFCRPCSTRSSISPR